jgi:hypothetical protein
MSGENYTAGKTGILCHWYCHFAKRFGATLWFNWENILQEKSIRTKGKNMASKKNVQTEETPADIAASNWSFIFKWLFIFGGIATGVVNALAINPDFTIPSFLIWVSVVIGIIVGIFYFNSDDLINVGLRFMIFSAAARSLPGETEIVAYATAFFLGFAFFLGPIVLTMAVIYFVKKYILNK